MVKGNEESKNNIYIQILLYKKIFFLNIKFLYVKNFFRKKI